MLWRAALLFCVLVVAVARGSLRDMSPSYLREAMYTSVSGYPCVRLLNSTHQIGCGQKHKLESGTLHLMQSESDVAAFEKHAEFGSSTVALLAPALFNRSVVERLHKTGNLVGVAVLWPGNFSDAQSPAPRRPNTRFGIDSGVDWNPLGDDFLSQDYRFPIWLVGKNDSAVLLEKALLNKKNKAFPRWGINMRTKMRASVDSKTCLRRSQCLPVGGQSVWASNNDFVTQKPVVFATATLDSNSFFHDLVPGVNAYLSGVIALAAAHVSLSQINMSSAPAQLAFAYFMGEAWDNMGSRRFVKDLTSFKCTKVDSDDSNKCLKPFALSTKFTEISLGDIEAVIDISQVAMTSNPGETPTLFLHSQPSNDSDVNTAHITKWIHGTSSLSTDLIVHVVSASTSGLAPSPAIAFHQASSAISALSFAEHDAAFTNKHYFSHLDNAQINETILCDVSTIIARSLYSIAWRATLPEVQNIKANCSLVRDLVQCLTVNFKCPLVEQYLGTITASDGTGVYMPSYYAGVYGSSISSPILHAATYFMHDFLFDATAPSSARVGNCSSQPCASGYECIGVSPNTTCIKAPVYYHNALPLGIDWDYSSSNWHVANKSESTWTESYWGTLSMEIYQLDDPSNDLAMLLCGLALLLVSVVSTLCCRRVLSKRYKLD